MAAEPPQDPGKLEVEVPVSYSYDYTSYSPQPDDQYPEQARNAVFFHAYPSSSPHVVPSSVQT